jgi:hypothetical protein
VGKRWWLDGHTMMPSGDTGGDAWMVAPGRDGLACSWGNLSTLVLKAEEMPR